MNVGKIFEQDFKNSVPEGVYYLKLQDPTVSYSQTQTTRFALKAPYDVVLCKDGQMYALELKSVQTKSLSYGPDKSCRIKEKQAEALCDAARSGAVAGFVLNFRKYDETYFVPAGVFKKHMESSLSKSFSFDDAKRCGIKIPQTKKKTHYRYDVSFLLGACSS